MWAAFNLACGNGAHFKVLGGSVHYNLEAEAHCIFCMENLFLLDGH